MTNVVPFPTHNRARILIHRDGDGDGFLIDHVGTGDNSYGLFARAETIEDAQVVAGIASERFGGLHIEVRA